ncbi:MAG: hypothetical protein V3R68_05100 [Gammaproteobacteria bacterium]
MKRSLILIFILFSISNIALADIISASDALARGDYATAAAEFKRLAEKGDDRAQAHLGYMYYVGEGVPQDYAEAVKWYRKAGVQGNRDAQYNLAVAYAFGEGVKQDLTEAAIWYRRAGEQGHMISQYSLGISYAYGEGVPQDATEAARWFRMAADQGYARAQVQLGSMYHTGDGVKQDYTEAVRWYRMAADRGDATAQYNLGAMYRSGRGVEQNYAQAKRWFRMAADQGYAAAQNELTSLERSAAASIAQRATPQVKPEITTSTKSSPSQAQEKQQTAQQAAAAETGSKEALFSVDKDTLLSLDETPPEEASLPIAEEETQTGIAGQQEKQETTVADTALSETAEDEYAPTSIEDTDEETETIAEEEPSGGLFSALGKLFATKKQDTETVTDPLSTESGDELIEEPEISSAITETTSSDDTTEASQPSTMIGGATTTVRAEGEEETQTGIAEQQEEPETTAADTTLSEATEDEYAPTSIEDTGEETETIAEEKPSGGLFRTLGKLFTDDISEPDPEDTGDAASDETLLARAETESPAFADEELAQEAEEDLIPKSVSAGRTALSSGDYSEALDQFLPLATQGDSEAQAHLGSMYYVGKGVEQDYGKAFDWYRRAAEQGNVDAQYSIGNMYLLGESVEQNNDTAAEWYARAAEQGHAAAQHNLDNLQRLAEQTEQETEEISSATEQEEVLAEAEQTDPETGEKAAEEKPSGGLSGFFGRLFTSDKQTDTGPDEAITENEPGQEDQTQPDEPAVETTVSTYAASEAPTGESLTSYSGEPSSTAEDETVQITTDSEPSDTTAEMLAEADMETASAETIVSAETESPDTDAVAETEKKTSFFKKLFGPLPSETSAETATAETGNTLEDDEHTIAMAEETAAIDSTFESSIASVDSPAGSDVIQQNDETSAALAEASDEPDTAQEESTKESTGLSGFFGKLFGSAENKEDTEFTEQNGDDEEQAIMQAMLDGEALPSPDQDTALSESATEEISAGDLDAGIAAIEKGDYEKAIEIIQPLAVAGGSDAQYQLGTLYYKGGGVKQDYTQASLWYRRAAELGNVDAQYSLGNMFLMGEGVYQNDAEAEQWYEKAAEQGHVSARHNLENLQRVSEAETQPYDESADVEDDEGGVLTFLGGLFESDESEARTETGSVTNETTITDEAQSMPDNQVKEDYERGLAYAFGDGVAQDDKTAFTWFMKAAEKEHAPAQYKVGVAYAYGEGVNRDLANAAEWYRKAADQGYIIAQRNLGMLLLNGDGVAQDKVQALAWYNLVADNGNAMDIRRRDMLRSELSEEQLKQSETLASELLSRY